MLENMSCLYGSLKSHQQNYVSTQPGAEPEHDQVCLPPTSTKVVYIYSAEYYSTVKEDKVIVLAVWVSDSDWVSNWMELSEI